MSEENLEQDVKISEPSDESGDGGAPSEGEEKAKRRGRPRRKAEEPETALTPVPPARAKKRPEDIKDPYAAIHRCHREMTAHVENLRQLHPETPCGDPVNPLDTTKDTKGAPIKKTAFHAPLIGMCKVAGFVGDLGDDELPKQEDYDRVAESWADASTHLGLTEKAAALFSAISESVHLVGFTAAKAVKKLIVGPPAPVGGVTKEDREMAPVDTAPADGGSGAND